MKTVFRFLAILVMGVAISACDLSFSGQPLGRSQHNTDGSITIPRGEPYLFTEPVRHTPTGNVIVSAGCKATAVDGDVKINPAAASFANAIEGTIEWDCSSALTGSTPVAAASVTPTPTIVASAIITATNTPGPVAPTNAPTATPVPATPSPVANTCESKFAAGWGNPGTMDLTGPTTAGDKTITVALPTLTDANTVDGATVAKALQAINTSFVDWSGPGLSIQYLDRVFGFYELSSSESCVGQTWQPAGSVIINPGNGGHALVWSDLLNGGGTAPKATLTVQTSGQTLDKNWFPRDRQGGWGTNSAFTAIKIENSNGGRTLRIANAKLDDIPQRWAGPSIYP